MKNQGNKEKSAMRSVSKVVAGVLAIVIIIAVLVAALFYVSNGKATSTILSTTSTIGSTSVSTSILSTSTSVSSTSTTTVPQFNFTQNVTINTIAINKTNVLFGIPNQSQFESLFFNVTSGGDYSSIYGLNFTVPIMTGTTETNITFTPTIPSRYANVTYPVAIYITITTYTMPEALKVFNDWYGPSTGFINGTYYINSTGHFSMNASKPYISKTNVKVYRNLNIGNASVAIDFNPMYHLDNYLLVYIYNRDMVVINSYGIPGKFNYTYVNNIGKHIYNVLVNGS